MSWFKRKPVQSVLFEPMVDISTIELALCVRAMHITFDSTKEMVNYYESMPPEVKRHFRLVTR